MSKAQRLARLKEIIRELIKKNLAEVSTTATAGIDGTGTGHYDTPNAFASGSQGGHPNPEVVGYKKVNEDVINEYVSSDNFIKDFNTAMNLVIQQANNLKGPLGKHPIKRNVSKLKAVLNLFMKFIAPTIKKADRDISKGFDLTRIKKDLADGKFKSVLEYQIMNRIGGRSYDSNEFYGIDDKVKKLLDRMHSELRKLVNIMDKAQLESVNESFSSIFIEISKAIKANRPDELNAIKDLGEEYDIGRVLYMARTNPKALRKAVDDRVKERKQFIKSKNLKEVTDKEINVIKKVVDNLKKLRQSFTKAMSIGDKELKNREYNKDYETILAAEKAMMAVVLKLKSKKMLGEGLNEGRYHDWRNDESMTPKQKVGQSMREIRDALNELDKTVKMNLKLKTELKMNSQDYWKNTHKALTKISERLVKMANKVGNLK